MEALEASVKAAEESVKAAAAARAAAEGEIAAANARYRASEQTRKLADHALVQAVKALETQIRWDAAAALEKKIKEQAAAEITTEEDWGSDMECDHDLGDGYHRRICRLCARAKHEKAVKLAVDKALKKQMEEKPRPHQGGEAAPRKKQKTDQPEEKEIGN